MAAFASNISIPRVDRVPATPEPFSASAVAAPDVFEACNSLLSASEASRTGMQARSRAGVALCRQALGRLHRGDLDTAETMLHESLALAPAPAVSPIIGEDSLAAQLEQARLTGAWAEAFVGAACFGSWLRTGVLSAPMPPSLASGIGELDDEKWLGGFINAVRALERYAVLRAERLDVTSVSCALDTAHAAEAALMEFEFRNSDLRRSYDGVKYTSKRIEEVLYEVRMALLRLEAASGAASAAAALGGVSVVARAGGDKDKSLGKGGSGVATAGGETLVVDVAVLGAVCKRYQRHDATREDVIKRCREPQKVAKSSVYALQRSEPDKAAAQLEACAASLNAIHAELLASSPSLRQSGSFLAVVEEYLEGWLLLAFVRERRLPSLPETQRRAGLAFEVTVAEYLGGAFDLTGEAVRLAVRAAGAQDRPQLGACLALVDTINEGAYALPNLPHGLQKKLGANRSALAKLEALWYEQALVAAGRPKGRPVDAPTVPNADGDGGTADIADE